MSIGTRIREIRENKNITQVELADKALTTQSTVAKIEKGLIEPKATLIPLFAEALECEIKDLFE